MTLDRKKLRTWLGHWHQVCGTQGPTFTAPEDLRGVLNDLRHDGPRLEALFADLPQGDAVLARIREVVSCESEAARGPYVVPVSQPAADTELVDLVEDALARARASGRRCDPEITGDIQVLRRPLDPADIPHTAPLTEALDDEMIWLESQVARRERTALHFLRETVFGLTADTAIQNYILTPLHFAVVVERDPYRPRFELWRRGATPVVTWGPLGEGVRIFVRPPA